MDKPSWMTIDGATVTLDADEYYPEFLIELGVSPDTADKLDLEIAKRFAGWTARLYLAVSRLDPRTSDKPVGLRIIRTGDKAVWAFKTRPDGKAKDMDAKSMRKLAAAEWKKRRMLEVPA